MNKNKNIICATAIFGCAVLFGAFIIFQNAAAAESGNASVSMEKDKSTGLFIFSIRDPQGILDFSFAPQNERLPYSGTLPSCPRGFKQNNVQFFDPGDFNPPMKALIVDCKGGETEFQILPPDENGTAKVLKITPEPLPPPPTPPPPAVKTTEETTAKEKEQSAETEAKKEFTYPIPKLGNCEDERACKFFCDKPSNMETCIDFAEKHFLLAKDEIEKGKKFVEVVKSGGGPGGCQTEQSCREYCNDVNKIDECIAFAEKEGFMSGKELDEAKKVREVVKRGQKLPGDCKNKAECEVYCKSGEHIDECFAFAKENGLMSEEELREAERMMPFIKSGQMPGGCKTKEECEAFCEDENNMEQCIAFAEKAGLIPQEELEMIKKTGGKGPGGCKGKACKDFCEKPENMEVCIAFAKEHGLIKEEDLRRMEEGQAKLKKELENAPPEVKECIESILGTSNLDKITAGPEIGEKMKECFFKSVPEELRGKFETGSDGGFNGPGGCLTREECEVYCMSNPDACKGFGPMGEEGHENFEERLSGAPQFEETLSGSPFSGETYPPGSEVKCDDTYDLISNPKTGRRYCAIKKCENETIRTTDNEGYFVCWTLQKTQRGAPSINNSQEQKGEFRPPENFQMPEGFQPPTDFRPTEDQNIPIGEFQRQPSPEELQRIQEEQRKQIEQQIQQEQFQQFTPPSTEPHSKTPSLFNLAGILLAPFAEILK